ncbi:MAG: hypothetical protein EOO77_20065 [Oxalobacteraceae bacterium]|nr:MAG: hypothetical protein EOO77_20065 [Oxalobacteraceae bacterium]
MLLDRRSRKRRLTDVTNLGWVEVLIASEALAESLDPVPDGVDPGTAMETFIEFESDIQYVGQLEVVNRLGGG